MHSKYVLTQTLQAVLATHQEEANSTAAGVGSLTPAPGGGREQVLIFGHTAPHWPQANSKKPAFYLL